MNIKTIISILSIVFLSDSFFAQNFIYEQNESKITKENTIVREDGGKKKYIDVLEKDLILEEFTNRAARESFLIVNENVFFADFSIEDLFLINSNRDDYYMVRTEINNKKIIILPKF